MPDDLDNLLRAAMKTLDDQVPSGYFEALPNQTLARLEGSMLNDSSGTSTETRDAAVPPMVAATVAAPSEMKSASSSASLPSSSSSSMKKAEREEDSGLHDIRNLAQSTKQRLSSRRSTANPIIEDDALASASGSWKNIALPQPAKMVSLPEIADLPTKAEVLAAEKTAKETAALAREAAQVAKEAEKAAKKAARESKKDIAAPAAAVAAVEPARAAPSIERKAFSLPSQQQKSSKGPLFAIVGLGVAAAAGGVIYMQMGKKSDEPAPAVATAGPEKAEKAPAAVTTTPIEPAAAPTPASDTAAGSAAAEAPVAQIAAPEEPKAEEPKSKGKAKKAPKEVNVEIVDPGRKTPEKPVEKKAAPAAKGGGSEEGEPSFDALLKEAGVDQNKKAQRPTLEKKSLTGDDFKKGMAAVAAKAQACYTGTQGTATVKLTIAPSGSVSKVTVGGAFSGKPEAACVAAAVKGASFPPWDGGPQSFNYSYMLSD